MAKKHCPKCTVDFHVGNPAKTKCGHRSGCPECGLMFHHYKTEPNFVRCWVATDGDHKHLLDGEFVPIGKRA